MDRLAVWQEDLVRDRNELHLKIENIKIWLRDHVPKIEISIERVLLSKERLYHMERYLDTYDREIDLWETEETS